VKFYIFVFLLKLKIWSNSTFFLYCIFRQQSFSKTFITNYFLISQLSRLRITLFTIFGGRNLLLTWLSGHSINILNHFILRLNYNSFIPILHIYFIYIRFFFFDFSFLLFFIYSFIILFSLFFWKIFSIRIG